MHPKLRAAAEAVVNARVAFAAVAAAAFGIIAFIAPQELPVALWKLALLTIAAFVGYWVDRHLFPYARPHRFINPSLQSLFTAACLRRAIIVAATMVALALAV